MNVRAYTMPKAGSMKKLQLQNQRLSAPVGDEVLVKVRAIGLNFADIFAIHGLYSATPVGSFIPGLEFCGEVHQIGPEVKSLKVGDPVFGVTRFGAYTSGLSLAEKYLRPLPKGWSFEEGASFAVQALTAYYGMVRLGNIQQGDTVLIHSAAGGVGIYAQRIAKTFGAYTLGVVGAPFKFKVLEEEAYDAFLLRSKSFASELQEKLEGRDLNLVMECNGGRYFNDSFDALAPMGRLVSYGSANFTTYGARPNMIKVLWRYLTRPRVDPLQMTRHNRSVMAFNLIWLYERNELMQSLLDELQSMPLGKPRVGHTFAFEKMHEALAFFQSGQSTGKVVVQVEH